MQLEEPGVLSIRLLVFSLCFIPVVIFHSRHFGLIVYSIPLFICYHVWMFICDIAAILIYHSDFLACSGYFRLSVYTWGIFLAYIRRRFSLRLCFHVFGEAGRDSKCGN